jgi:hypothetical protein
MIPSMLPIRVLALAAVVLLLPVVIAAAQPRQRIPLIVDTDANNELDDQHALAYVLLNGDAFDVKGVTVNATRGGGDIRAQTEEARRVMALCDVSGIPLHPGANGSFSAIRPTMGQADFDGKAAVDFIIARAEAQPAGTPLVLLPIGKLTNVALALARTPGIAKKVRIVWLGSNYPDPGEYNQENDLDVPFEIATVRYGKGTGTDAVRVTREEISSRMRGKGPRAAAPVTGRHGGTFTTFGDYSVNLFEHIELDGNPPSRALYDMAAAAILKNPSWAESEAIGAPELVKGRYAPRPDNPRRVTLWTHFERDAIVTDFFATMDKPVLTR